LTAGNGGRGLGSRGVLQWTHQRRLFAADKSAAAETEFDIKIKAGTEDILAQETVFTGLINRDLQTVDGDRILGTDIDKALVRADRKTAIVIASRTTWGSPSRTERSINAPGSPSSALQQTYFTGAGPMANCHFIPVGKPAPPRPRSPEALMMSTTSWGVMLVMHAAEGFVPFNGNVFVDILRIYNTAVSESNAHLLLVKLRVIQVFNGVVVKDCLLIQKSLDNSALDDVLVNDFFGILRLHAE
jgi:hypothetical protein